VTEALWELAANAVEHSDADGFALGQVIGEQSVDHCLQLAIGDIGIGIRGSFLRGGVHLPPTDADALGLAVRYLISSVPDSGRGQGLWTTFEETVGLDGSAILRSGTARLLRGRTGSRTARVPQLPGTIVFISLPCG
jgi:hypothetical protein